MSLDRTWRLRLFLMLTTTSIVTAKYHPFEASNSEEYADYRRKNSNVTTIDQEKKSEYKPLFKLHKTPKVAHVRHRHSTKKGPYFENAEGQVIESQHVTANLGDITYLNCRVAMLSDTMVMWVRMNPEKSLLTIGKQTFISNPRYSVQFKYPNNWRLAINAIQKDDEGIYICQLNTFPLKLLTINVTVLEPELQITDETNHELLDRYYDAGSMIELTCIARRLRFESDIPYPVWRKNGKDLPTHILIYSFNRTKHELITRMRIEQAQKSDGGEFDCSVGQMSKVIVNIHVMNGEMQAAVYHDQWNSAKSSNKRRIEEALCNVLAAFLFLNITLSYLL